MLPIANILWPAPTREALGPVQHRGAGRRRLLWMLLAGVSFGEVAGCSPVNPSDIAEGSVAQSLSRISTAQVVEVDLGVVAETLALNTRSTEVQREALERQLVGNTVLWSIKVYEFTKDGEAYRILSEPIAITDPAATPLLRVLAVVFPQSAEDRGAIEALRTGDTLAVKGFVQGITLRTVLTLHPAVLAVGSPVT